MSGLKIMRISHREAHMLLQLLKGKTKHEKWNSLKARLLHVTKQSVEASERHFISELKAKSCKPSKEG